MLKYPLRNKFQDVGRVGVPQSGVAGVWKHFVLPVTGSTRSFDSRQILAVLVADDYIFSSLNDQSGRR